MREDGYYWVRTGVDTEGGEWWEIYEWDSRNNHWWTMGREDQCPTDKDVLEVGERIQRNGKKD